MQVYRGIGRISQMRTKRKVRGSIEASLARRRHRKSTFPGTELAVAVAGPIS
jgi:hypothetical protein